MRSRIKIPLTGLALATMATGASMAGERPAAALEPMSQSHQVVFRDPLTGEVRAPIEAELAKLPGQPEHARPIQPRSLDTSARGGTSFQWRTVWLEDGTEAQVARIPEQFHSSLVIEAGPDGKPQLRHAEHALPAAPESSP